MKINASNLLVLAAMSVSAPESSGNSTITTGTSVTITGSVLDGGTLTASKFEKAPPLATAIEVKKAITGDQLVLTVQFSKEDTALIPDAQLEVAVGDAKVLLNDKGLNGDEKPGDGVFSAPSAVKAAEIVSFAEQNNAAIAQLKGVDTVFVGRSALVRNLKPLNIPTFQGGQKVSFDVAPSNTVNGSSLVGIREKSLIVRDVSVVDDPIRTYDPCRPKGKGNPQGAWSFATLSANIANTALTGVTNLQFLVDWVDNHAFAQQVNATSKDTAPARNIAKEKFVKAWMKNSGLAVPRAAGIPVGWTSLPLKPQEFPVRLLAIVNRIDLRGNTGYGMTNAGEGRFVFCFVDSNKGSSTYQLPNGDAMASPMTIIFEYGIPLFNLGALESYAGDWWALRNIPFGKTYNEKLEAITKVFTAANANSMRANGSALNHLRTNEFIQSPWAIRDFEVVAATKMLKLIAPNKEPMASFNGPANTPAAASLQAFVNALPFSPISSPDYTIPPSWAAMHAPMPRSIVWQGSPQKVITPLKRREFSLNSCSGCHTAETNTSFLHVRPRNVGNVAALSGFLTGMGVDSNPSDNDYTADGYFYVNDPWRAAVLPPKQFNESMRRAKDLANFVANSQSNATTTFTPEFRRVLSLQQSLRFLPVNMED